jgi:hypothetical protein
MYKVFVKYSIKLLDYFFESCFILYFIFYFMLFNATVRLGLRLIFIRLRIGLKHRTKMLGNSMQT